MNSRLQAVHPWKTAYRSVKKVINTPLQIMGSTSVQMTLYLILLKKTVVKGGLMFRKTTNRYCWATPQFDGGIVGFQKSTFVELQYFTSKNSIVLRHVNSQQVYIMTVYTLPKLKSKLKYNNLPKNVSEIQ